MDDTPGQSRTSASPPDTNELPTTMALITESRFSFLTPNNLPELTGMLGKYGGQARICAGGTDLFVQVTEGALHPRYLLSTSRLEGFDKIEFHKGVLTVGSLATIRAIEKSGIISETFPVLAEAAREIGSVQVRNVATLGGNLCQNIKCAEYNQSHISDFMRESIKPCFKAGGRTCIAPVDSVRHVITEKGICRAPFSSDLGLALHCLDAFVTVTSVRGERTIPIRQFYNGPFDFNLKGDEFITKANVTIKGSRLGSGFAKYKQTANGYGIVAVAASARFEGDNSICRSATISIGGVAPTPFEALEAESLLEGRELSDEVVKHACETIFRSARFGGAAHSFKIALARSLARTALEKAASHQVEID